MSTATTSLPSRPYPQNSPDYLLQRDTDLQTALPDPVETIFPAQDCSILHGSRRAPIVRSLLLRPGTLCHQTSTCSDAGCSTDAQVQMDNSRCFAIRFAKVFHAPPVALLYCLYGRSCGTCRPMPFLLSQLIPPDEVFLGAKQD